jgi:hypothetical protein
MQQAVLEVAGLPAAPLDAAAEFHATHLPRARAALPRAQALVLRFAPAGHEHRGWRLAAVQELAREAAPKRVNAIVGGDRHAAAETLAYLASAPGVTGQLLAVDGKSAETR